MIDLESQRARKLIFFFAVLALLNGPMYLLNAGLQSLDIYSLARAMKMQKDLDISDSLWNLIWNIPHYFGSFATVVDVIAGIGLLGLKRWARLLAIAIVWCRVGFTGLVFALLFYIAAQKGEDLAKFPQGLLMEWFLFIAWSSFVTYSLSRPKVKEQFK